MRILENIENLLEAGGNVLWIIFFSLFILWLFIIERYYFLFKIFPSLSQLKHKNWRNRSDKNSAFAKYIRQKEISEMSRNLNRFIPTIQTLVSISPLLGLLGTVTGMIIIFDVMAKLGTGNARLMASGISMAVIPTMAGMISAISGIYFENNLRKNILQKQEYFKEGLN